MLVLHREIHHLCYLGFGDFIGEHAAYADAFLVDVEHYPGCFIGIHLEKTFEDMDDKFHRGVIVVEQQHFIEAGLFRLWPCARGEADAWPAAVANIIGVVAHSNLHFVKIGHGVRLAKC